MIQPAHTPPHAIASLDGVPGQPPRLLPWWAWAGVIVILLAEIALFARIDPVPAWFFVFVWYGFILLADGLLFWYEGRSLLHSRWREFLVMLPLSAACWTFFEILNFRLDNWQYENLIHPMWLRLIGFALAFATVFPGLFLTADLLRAMAVHHNWGIVKWRMRPIRISAKIERRLWWLGAACLILPMIAPKFFFPLVWGAMVPLLEPWNRRHGLPSLYRDLENGDPRRILLLLLAGFICGGLWEFWNFWALSKWIYTIPFVGHFKIFEMPVLGFFGFPPFTLECFTMYYACMTLLRTRRL